MIWFAATHEQTDDPLGYWSDFVADANFGVVASGTVERSDEAYCYAIGK